MPMTHGETIAAYSAAWNEPDGARRAALLDRVWADGATYTDPAVHAMGAAQLSAHVDAVLARFPGSRVVLTSAIDAHHGLARFGWRRVLADGTERPEGIDFAEFAPDGKLARIVGFFGPLRAPGRS